MAAEQLSRRRLTRTATPAMRPLLRHHLVPQLLKPKIWLRGGHEGALRFPRSQVACMAMSHPTGRERRWKRDRSERRDNPRQGVLRGLPPLRREAGILRPDLEAAGHREGEVTLGCRYGWSNSPCPLWVISGHRDRGSAMSALPQKRTSTRTPDVRDCS